MDSDDALSTVALKSLSEKIADKEPDDDEESQVNLKDIFGSFGI